MSKNTVRRTETRRRAGARLWIVLCTLHVLLQSGSWFQSALPVCCRPRPQWLLKANRNEERTHTQTERTSHHRWLNTFYLFILLQQRSKTTMITTVRINSKPKLVQKRNTNKNTGTHVLNEWKQMRLNPKQTHLFPQHLYCALQGAFVYIIVDMAGTLTEAR